MLERNSWISMNRRTVNRSVLGIRREDGDEISKSVPTSRIFLVITILTGIGFLISLSAFSIYSSRNNTSRILSITKNKNNNLNDFNKNMTIKTESIDTILNRTTIEEVSREIIEQEQSRLDNREDNEERFIEEDTSASSKSLDISSRHSRAYPEQQHPSTTTTGLNSQINSRGIMNKKLNNNNNNNIDDQSGANPSVTQYGEQYAQLEQYYHYPSSVSSSSREKGIKRKELDDNIKGRIEHMVMSSGPAIKFTGVYVRGPFEHLDPQIYSNQYMNSNQYGSDPFVKYKPQHPSEINHLAASSTTYDIDTGPRFSNKVVRPTRVASGASVNTGGGKITEAIFHPYDAQDEDITRRNPLKIMLDVYPVSEESDNVNQPIRGGRLMNRKPSRPNDQGHRMIVHLNLYPKKTSKVRKTTEILSSLVPGRIEERNFDTSNTTIDDEIEIDEFNIEEGEEKFISNSRLDDNIDEYNDAVFTTTEENIIYNDDNIKNEDKLTFEEVFSSMNNFTNIDSNNSNKSYLVTSIIS